MKKVLCLLLCAIMLLGVLISCGEDSNTPAETTPGAQNGATTPSTPNNSGSNGDPNGTTASQPSGALYEKHTPIDFGDSMGNPRSFTMVVRKNRWKYLHGDESSTETVTMAAYKRNMILVDMYNIDFQMVEVNGDAPTECMTVMGTADGEYDVILPDFWWGIEYAGHFENIMNLKEINDADDYWIQGWNESLIINNRMYTIAGDACLELYENLEVIFYNSAIAEEYDYDLYQEVIDDTWTFDTMISTMDVFEDALNNNDSTDDVYGVLYDQASLECNMFAAGLTLLKTNRNNGIISVVANTTRNINISDKMSEVILHPATDYVETTGRRRNIDLFINGNSFMYAGCLYKGPDIKSRAAFNYGIVVMPKYEESDDYLSTSYGLSPFAIAATCMDVNMAACIIDTMNWLSNTEDTPYDLGEDRLVYTYYSTVLQGQVAESPQDVEMLNLARDVMVFDFGYIAAVADMTKSFRNAVDSGSSVASIIDSIESAAEVGITDMVNFYNK